jgi:hypothetical protein
MATEKIKQIISEELDKFLTEELGISEMVNDETVRICQLINNTVMSIKSEKYDDYTLRSGKLDVTLFGDFDVTIDFSFINFKTIDAFEKYVDKLNLCGYSSYIQHKIGINFFAISGEIDDKSLYDQCQHELSHLFMAHEKGEKLFSNKRSEDYELSIRLMNGQSDTDKMLGRVLYLSFNEEQNAFVNGAYRLMVNNFNNSQPYNILLQSDAHKILVELKKYEEMLLSDNFDEDKINITLSKIKNKDLNWFKKWISIIIKNFEKKLFRAFYKAKKEYEEYILKIEKGK